MSKIMVIVNPISANGRTRRNWPKVAEYLREAGVMYHHQFTGSTGDATRITSSALQRGYDTIISVGGDGTLNEVLNGFIANDQAINPNAQLGVITMGTGGDFVKTAMIPRDPKQACEIIARGNTRTIDVGKVVCHDHQGEQVVRYYINVAGLGLEGEVVDRVNHTSKALGGFLSFLWGTLVALVKYRNHRIMVEIDGTVRYQGRNTMVAVGNGQYFGGGMRIAPEAKLDSGCFNIVIVDGLNKMKIIASMPELYKGTHLKLPGVLSYQGSEVKVTSPETVLMDVDGEQVGKLDAEFTILPGAIKLIC